MSPFVEDLRYAQTIQHAVQVQLLNGRTYKCTGVKEVDEEGNWVALWNPQTFGDDTTFDRVALDLVAGVSVLDIDYRIN